MVAIKDMINDTDSTYYTTGSVGLDYIISGGRGIPGGRFVEIYGRSDTGKTAAVLQIMSETLQLNTGKIMYFNLDGKFNPDFAVSMGVPSDVGHDTLAIINDIFIMSDVFNMIQHNASTNKYDVFIVDNIAAMSTEKEIMSDFEDTPSPRHFLYQLDKGLRDLRRAISNTNAIVIFTNQIRHNFDTGFGYKPAFDTSVGPHMDIRIDLTRVENITRASDMLFGNRRIGHRVQFEVTENAIYRTLGRCQLALLYNENMCGFDIPDEYIVYGFETGIVRKGDNGKYRMQFTERYGDPPMEVTTDDFSNEEMRNYLAQPHNRAYVRDIITNALKESDKWYGGEEETTDAEKAHNTDEKVY